MISYLFSCIGSSGRVVEWKGVGLSDQGPILYKDGRRSGTSARESYDLRRQGKGEMQASNTRETIIKTRQV
jgi:hypothetical protein